MVGDMLRVVRDEILEHAIDLARRNHATLGLYAAHDHCASAAANQVACGRIRHRRQIFAGKLDVERRDEIRRGIDQRAIKIKNDDRAAHGEIVNTCSRLKQVYWVRDYSWGAFKAR